MVHVNLCNALELTHSIYRINKREKCWRNAYLNKFCMSRCYRKHTCSNMYFGLVINSAERLFIWQTRSKRRRLAPKVMKHSQTQRGFILGPRRESRATPPESMLKTRKPGRRSFALRRREFSSGVDIEERGSRGERTRKDRVSPQREHSNICSVDLISPRKVRWRDLVVICLAAFGNRV